MIAHIEASHRTTDGLPQQIDARIYVPTKDDALAIVAQLPKSVGVRANNLINHSTSPATVTGIVQFFVNLVANGNNGGVNETGLKRYRSLRKHLARLGYTITWETRYSNSYRTEEAFEAAIAS